MHVDNQITNDFGKLQTYIAKEAVSYIETTSLITLIKCFE
jgi:hypothetical protein